MERLNAVDRMTQYCGYPSSGWLHAMIIKLYKQMMESRVHTKKKCRKILWPESDFSPTIQMWYNRIHAYLQLIRLKEGKARNVGNILRFARQQHIKQPNQLMMDELKDGLQLACIRKANLCKREGSPEGPSARLSDRRPIQKTTQMGCSNKAKM